MGTESIILWKRAVCWVLAAAALAILASCGGQPPKEEKPPPVLRVSLAAETDANRGPGGRALPIVVRLYELKAQGAFNGADFFSLYGREAEALGGELIAREELTLAPGQTSKMQKTLDPQTRYLGILGAFRDIDKAAWRSLVPIPEGKDMNVEVAVGPTAIRGVAR
jgi:type VI secretion system protein VasD